MAKSTSSGHVDLDNARELEQTRIMEQIIEEGHCPFCLVNFKKYNRQPILKEGQHWILTTNQWPYRHTKHHFLLITKQHIENITELEPVAASELFEIAQWAVRQYQIPGGGLVMRFGDTNYSAGSVTHLHAQLVQPDLDDPEYQPTRIKIGKNPDKLAKD